MTLECLPFTVFFDGINGMIYDVEREGGMLFDESVGQLHSSTSGCAVRQTHGSADIAWLRR